MAASRSGRPRKPTADKIAIGNPGNYPLPEDEPEYHLASITPPTNLSPEEVVYWNWFAPRSIGAQILTEVSVPGLVRLCKAIVESERMSEEIERDGFMVDTRNGPVRHPLITPRNQANDQILRWMREFGFTPASQSTVHAIGKTDRPKTQEEELLGFD